MEIQKKIKEQDPSVVCSVGEKVENVEKVEKNENTKLKPGAVTEKKEVEIDYRACGRFY